MLIFKVVWVGILLCLLFFALQELVRYLRYVPSVEQERPDLSWLYGMTHQPDGSVVVHAYEGELLFECEADAVLWLRHHGYYL